MATCSDKPAKTVTNGTDSEERPLEMIYGSGPGSTQFFFFFFLESPSFSLDQYSATSNNQSPTTGVR